MPTSPVVPRCFPPMYPGAQAIGDEEEQAVLEVLRTRRLFRYYGVQPGESKVAALESAFAAHTGATHALAVSSGTAALVCALAALEVGPGDEVIVPAYTWIASAFAVTAVGAVPVFAEIDETLTLDLTDVEQKITPRTKVIMPVHMRGAPADIERLCMMARARGIRVLEDVAQANGGRYRGRFLGTFGDVGCFSLQYHKIITCGEGGLLVTSNATVHQRALMYHDPIGGRSIAAPEDVLLGMNFRMPELTAAVAVVQLGRLQPLVEAIRSRHQMLTAGIRDAVARVGGSFRAVTDAEGDTSIALIYFMPSAELADRVTTTLRLQNINAITLYRPDRVDYHVYAHWAAILEKRTWTPHGGPWRWAAPISYDRNSCPRSLDLLSRAVHIDVNPLLSAEDIDAMIVSINGVLESLPPAY